MAAAKGSLNVDRLEWSPEPATCVVMASGGYPGPFETGEKISGIEDVEGAVVFHMPHTKLDGEDLVTGGGRVLGGADRLPGTRQSARIDAAYAAVGKIHFAGMHFRKDIGNRGLRRYNKAGSGP